MEEDRACPLILTKWENVKNQESVEGSLHISVELEWRET